MRPLGRATAKHFQQEVAELLQLPAGCKDADVRKELLMRGAGLVAWYDTRLQAIAESKNTKTETRTRLSAGQRVKRRD